MEDFYYSYSILQKQIPDSTPKNYIQHHSAPSPAHSILSMNFGFTIARPHLILTLKHHLYSGNHGLPLSTFSHGSTAILTSEIDASDTYTVNFSILPKIVSNRLLLRCTYDIPSATSAGDLEDWDLPLCRHFSTSTHDNAWFGTQLQPLDDRLVPALASHVSAGRCSFCKTDWCVEEIRGKKRERWDW